MFQVKEVEGQIRQRKSEVEQLIKEMREANMESLAISPPEESKQFLEGELDLTSYYGTPLANIDRKSSSSRSQKFLFNYSEDQLKQNPSCLYGALLFSYFLPLLAYVNCCIGKFE